MSDTAAIESKLLPEAPLLVLPSLATVVGLNEAIVLQQLHYRARIAPDGWWQAGVRELCREFPFWSEPTVKRTLRGLRRDGLVEVRQLGTDRTNRWRIDYAALKQRVHELRGQSDPLHRVNLSTNRSAASGQSDPIPIDRGRGTTKRGEAPARKFSRFDQAVQR